MCSNCGHYLDDHHPKGRCLICHRDCDHTRPSKFDEVRSPEQPR